VPLLSPQFGLTVLPHPTAPLFAYGTSAGGSLSLFIQNNSTTTALSTGLATVADKCVWLPSTAPMLYCGVPSAIGSSAFLDDWYRGVAHTSDNWWVIDGMTGDAHKLYSPQSSDNVQLDVVDPHIDPSGNYIAFKNNTDQSLWVLKIPHTQ